MLDSKVQLLTQLMHWFKSESIPFLTKLIDEGTLDNLDLNGLNAIYQVFRERFSKTLYPDKITDSTKDPLLIVKFFCDNGMSSATKDLKEHIMRIFIRASLEEFIYFWEMGYFTYVEEHDLKMWLNSKANNLYRILNSPNSAESVVISILKD